MHRNVMRVARVAGLAGLFALVALPASAENERGLATRGVGIAAHLSSGALTAFYLQHPDLAPEGFVEQVNAVREQRGTAGARAGAAPRARSQQAAAATPGGTRFTNDTTGLPQNEESVTVCPTDTSVVLGGTNDYRGLVLPSGDFTGWHFSATSGASLTNEGQLPPVRIGGGQVPSGGDPVVSALPGCNLYAASLNYLLDGPDNGIGLYRSNPATLASCPGGDDPSCWPLRRVVAEGAPGHFLDKEWMTTGESGSAGKVVWVTWTDFNFTADNPAGFTASIMAARCTDDLRRCSAPKLISGGDRDVQFSDVTIGDDGRTYVSWSEITGEIEGTHQTFIHKLRVAEPGSLDFGPTQVVYREEQPIPFGGKLNADAFRVATYAKNSVATVNGKPRVYLTWEACSELPLDFICESAVVKLTYSDDLGATWTRPTVVSVGGNNYFPSIDQDGAGRLAIAYYTSRFDPVFDNRQDVELVTLDAASLTVTKRQRLTSVSNEPEADPLLDSRFIGDYIEVTALGGRAWVHSNENYTRVRLLGMGRPVPQQDNYLQVAPL